jgi:hypothetical protein
VISITVNKESEVFEVLNNLRKLNLINLNKRLADHAAARMRRLYLQRWGGRGEDVYSFYGFIKQFVGGGATRGLFTGSTWNAIRPSSDAKQGGVYLAGKWPNRTASQVPFRTYNINFSDYSFQDKGGEYHTHEGLNAEVEVSSRGIDIKWHTIHGSWVNLHPEGFEHRTYTGEPYAGKTFGTGPGAKHAGDKASSKEFLYLEDVQQNELRDITAGFIEDILRGTTPGGNVMGEAEWEAFMVAQETGTYLNERRGAKHKVGRSDIYPTQKVHYYNWLQKHKYRGYTRHLMPLKEQDVFETPWSKQHTRRPPSQTS